MSDQDVIFEDCDTDKETAIKTVHLWAGTDELRKELSKLGITYNKNVKGLCTFYNLILKSGEKIKVRL